VNSIAFEQAIVLTRSGIERLNVDQYHRMIEQGILREGDPIELIDGILVRIDRSDRGGDPMSHGARHAYCLQQLRKIEGQLKQSECHVRQQLPITISDHRKPEPDGAIVAHTTSDYMDHHPTGSDCRVVIEVSDSSLAYDQTVKQAIYAAAGIPVYLIINIPERQIERYTTPIAADSCYLDRPIFKRGSALEIVTGGDTTIHIATVTAHRRRRDAHRSIKTSANSIIRCLL
jgi:Uma2 family endonuclease